MENDFLFSKLIMQIMIITSGICIITGVIRSLFFARKDKTENQVKRDVLEKNQMILRNIGYIVATATIIFLIIAIMLDSVGPNIRIANRIFFIANSIAIVSTYVYFFLIYIMSAFSKTFIFLNNKKIHLENNILYVAFFFVYGYGIFQLATTKMLGSLIVGAAAKSELYVFLIMLFWYFINIYFFILITYKICKDIWNIINWTREKCIKNFLKKGNTKLTRFRPTKYRMYFVKKNVKKFSGNIRFKNICMIIISGIVDGILNIPIYFYVIITNILQYIKQIFLNVIHTIRKKMSTRQNTWIYFPYIFAKLSIIATLLLVYILITYKDIVSDEAGKLYVFVVSVTIIPFVFSEIVNISRLKENSKEKE